MEKENTQQNKEKETPEGKFSVGEKIGKKSAESLEKLKEQLESKAKETSEKAGKETKKAKERGQERLEPIKKEGTQEEVDEGKKVVEKSEEKIDKTEGETKEKIEEVKTSPEKESNLDQEKLITLKNQAENNQSSYAKTIKGTVVDFISSIHKINQDSNKSMFELLKELDEILHRCDADEKDIKNLSKTPQDSKELVKNLLDLRKNVQFFQQDFHKTGKYNKELTQKLSGNFKKYLKDNFGLEELKLKKGTTYNLKDRDTARMVQATKNLGGKGKNIKVEKIHRPGFKTNDELWEYMKADDKYNAPRDTMPIWVTISKTNEAPTTELEQEKTAEKEKTSLEIREELRHKRDKLFNQIGELKYRWTPEGSSIKEIENIELKLEKMEEEEKELTRQIINIEKQMKPMPRNTTSEQKRSAEEKENKDQIPITPETIAEEEENDTARLKDKYGDKKWFKNLEEKGKMDIAIKGALGLELKDAREEFAKAKKERDQYSGALGKTVFKFLFKERKVKAEKAHQEALEDLKKKEAEYIGNNVKWAVNAKMMEVQEQANLNEKEKGWISKTFKWLGDQNLEKAGWKPKGRIGRMIARGASLRTLTSVTLLGISGGMAGLGVAGAGGATALGALIGRTAFVGTGTAVGTYDMMKNFTDIRRKTIFGGRINAEITDQTSKKEAEKIKKAKEEFDKMTPEDVEKYMSQMEATAAIRGEKVSRNADYMLLRRKYTEIIAGQEADKISEALDKSREDLESKEKSVKRGDNYRKAIAMGLGLAAMIPGFKKITEKIAIEAEAAEEAAKAAATGTEAPPPVETPPGTPIIEEEIPTETGTPIIEEEIPAEGVKGTTITEEAIPTTKAAEALINESYIETVPKGGTLWGLGENQLEERFGEDFAALNKAQQTYIIDHVKDYMVKKLQAAGQNPDVLKVGQEIDFSDAFKDPEFINKGFAKALNLSNAQIENIVKNNNILEEWVKANPGQQLTSEKVKTILGSAIEKTELSISPKAAENFANLAKMGVDTSDLSPGLFDAEMSLADTAIENTIKIQEAGIDTMGLRPQDLEAIGLYTEDQLGSVGKLINAGMNPGDFKSLPWETIQSIAAEQDNLIAAGIPDRLRTFFALRDIASQSDMQEALSSAFESMGVNFTEGGKNLIAGIDNVSFDKASGGAVSAIRAEIDISGDNADVVIDYVNKTIRIEGSGDLGGEGIRFLETSFQDLTNPKDVSKAISNTINAGVKNHEIGYAGEFGTEAAETAEAATAAETPIETVEAEAPTEATTKVGGTNIIEEDIPAVEEAGTIPEATIEITNETTAEMLETAGDKIAYLDKQTEFVQNLLEKYDVAYGDRTNFQEFKDRVLTYIGRAEKQIDTLKSGTGNVELSGNLSLEEHSKLVIENSAAQTNLFSTKEAAASAFDKL